MSIAPPHLFRRRSALRIAGTEPRRGARYVIAAVVTIVAGSVVAQLDSFGFPMRAAVLFAGALLVVLAAPIIVAADLAHRERRAALWIGALLFALVTSFLLAGWILRAQQRASKARGDRICAALDEYRQSNGAYPASLDRLVPNWLPAIPASCMGIFRTIPFRYSSGDGGYTLGFASPAWVECTRGPTTTWECGD